MKILVTGGAGFIGSVFVAHCLGREMKVTVLDAFMKGSDRRNLPEEGPYFNLLRGDVRDYEILERVAEQQDIVVHFAAQSHNDRSLKNPQEFFDVNVMGTLNVVRVCQKFGLRLHHVSTDEVFGDMGVDEEREFDESSPYLPSSPYSASKASSDHIVRSWVRSFGLQATISNCSNNYGKNQHIEKLIPHTISRLIRGFPPAIYGDGKNVRDWIHVDDHVRGILSVLQRGKIGETYLFGARNRMSNLQVVASILEAFGAPGDFFEFVEDRPGHDRKYAINPSKSETELKWFPSENSLEATTPELIDHVRIRHFS